MRLFLSRVLDEVITESENCLSQNHKLFVYFLAAKSKKKKNLIHYKFKDTYPPAGGQHDLNSFKTDFH